MITVQETSPGVFQPVHSGVIDSLDGERRAPLQVILHESWTPEERAEFRIFLVEPAPVPTGHRVTAAAYACVDGLVVQQIETVLHVPTSVTPLQMRKALRAAGLKPTVDAYIATLDEETIEAWEYATTVERGNALIAAAAVGLGMTEEQVDDLFRLAANL